METFPAVAEKVLKEFQVLLQHSPPPIGSTRMLQLMTINMFAVHNSQLKGKAWLASLSTQIKLNLASSVCYHTTTFPVIYTRAHTHFPSIASQIFNLLSEICMTL